MTEVILVLNAGSSSIKFSIFALEGEERSLALVYRGEMEGIGAQPRFVVSDSTGKHVVEERVTARAAGDLNHEDALLRERYLKMYNGKRFIHKRIKSYLTG